MADLFDRPTDVTNIQDVFSATEVGVTHPNTPAFMKLLDNGDVEIIVQDGLGIIFSASDNTLTLMAHAIRFLTTDTNGLVWNKTAFNDQATTYSEAALVTLTDNDLSQLFSGTDIYTSGI